MDTEKEKRHDKQGSKASKKSISQKFNLWNIFIWLTVLLGIVLIINIILTFNLNKDLQKSAESAKEKLKPAKIGLTLIKNSKCADCFDISTIASRIKNANVNVTKQENFEFDSKEGKAIISKYKVDKVPTVILAGEIDKVNIQGFEKKENALLLTKLEPPYTDAATGKIVGKVALYHLKDSACERCSNLTILINQIKSSGVRISEEKTVSPTSDEGKELIKKYNIGFAPTVILSKDASVYGIIQQAWPAIGSKETDGSYVLRLVNPPFINLTTGKLRGIVDVVYLTDKSCSECYDVGLHREILTNQQSFAIKLDKEEKYDISDAKGKELIIKYNITQVPAVILSNEVGVYPSSQVLKQFYSIENDNSFVFRKAAVLGTYRDLAANKIVKAQQSQGQ